MSVSPDSFGIGEIHEALVTLRRVGFTPAHLTMIQVSEEIAREVVRVSSPENPYASEQCEQTAFYPKGFAMPSPEDQAVRLKKTFGFEPMWNEAVQNLPFPTGEFGADGIGLFPCLSFLGQIWEIEDPRVAGYGKAIATACDKFGKWSMAEMNVPLVNYRTIDRDELTRTGLVRIAKRTLETITLLEDLAMSQGFNCLAIPVCLGDWGTRLCYSPRNALWQTLNLTPRRLAIEPVAGLSLVVGTKVMTTHKHQWKDFPGAQYNWHRVDRWSDSLYLSFDDGRFRFGAGGADYADGRYGSMVAFPGESGLVA